MTPKEKAKELVDKFRYDNITYKGTTTTIEVLPIGRAKQCALICVDEKQKSYLKAFKGSVSIKEMAKNKPYYLHLEEVKKEIEKL